jgi:Flp pilus assembly protein TadG
MRIHYESEYGLESRNLAHNRQCGQSLLEMALMLPFLLLLTLGVIEIGRFAYIDILVGNAARAGAAWGAEDHGHAGDSTGIANAVNHDFQNFNGQTLSVTSAPLCSCDSGGSLSPNPPYTSFCYAPPDGTNTTAGKCSGGGRWAVLVTVTASGTFTPLFNYPGIPSSIALSSTATVPVD